MNGIGYIRVSTDGQDDGYGKDVQKNIISKYANENNINIIEWVEDTISGTSDWVDRKGLALLLSDNTNYVNPPYECILVAKNDRIARDIEKYYVFKHEFIKKGIKLISASEDFGSMGIYAPVMEAFVVAMAEVERSLIVMRTQGGKKLKLDMGGYAGGSIPYGYIIKDKEYVINEEEAKIVREIFNMLDAKYTYSMMCRQLNAKCTTRNGKTWERGSLYSIIKRRKFYEGYNMHNIEKKGTQQPIIKEKEDAKN